MYQITVRYRTPAGRAAEYTEEVGRRRVASITGFTGVECE